MSRNPYYILLSRRKADLLGLKGKIAVSFLPRYPAVAVSAIGRKRGPRANRPHRAHCARGAACVAARTTSDVGGAELPAAIAAAAAASAVARTDVAA